MIRIQSEQEMLEMFRPIDREQVRVPGDMQFPLAVTDYLAWPEPGGVRTFLVFEDQRTLEGRGVVFRKSQPPAESVANMCEWCHSVAGSQSIGILTAAANKKTRVGINLCRDLSCKQNVQADPPSVHDMRESISREEKTRRITQRMAEFTNRNLL